MPTQIEKAILMALSAHRGQTDKVGMPYILHPLRVMGYLELDAPEDVRCAAVLHDVVEDTSVTVDRIRGVFGDAVACMVDLMTRRDGQTYKEYIKRLVKSESPGAISIKLCDIRDNSDPSRGRKHSASRSKRAGWATRNLLQALKWTKGGSYVHGEIAG